MAEYVIRVTRRAQKDLADLPEQLQAKAQEVIQGVETQPNAGTKLRGKLNGKWAVRLGRSHRIIYEIDGSDVVVLVVRDRKDAYR